TYCVQFSGLPASHVFTLANQGGDDGVDSDANPADGQVQNINLSDVDPTIDAGIYRNGSIAGLAWCESATNANTSYDA
ncbi:SdrD B-like domain-containing protein, partial [Marinicella litoralis]|uniref:SdrD B-like domain-containing protein n=1 Tax=Marinicella litoralis TaxID=644220 RepID=UPI001C557ACB